ncbi:MAG: hypothetical protein LAP87_04930 [Acidobacteriia bacterium]|nr:hypothetical protein [Terriglobia bacterium]
MLPQLSHAGEWFLRSGIQEPTGGVARYYRADLGRNHAVSTEITAYAASALVYLHAATGERRYLDRAAAAARFLVDAAWDPAARAMPFEVAPPEFIYFFDCGIVVRGLLAAWRATGCEELLGVATALGRSMACDFAAPDGSFHPILALPGKRPLERDPQRWSRSAGCYQLKAALGWWELADATGDSSFREPYERLLESSLRTWGDFLPGHPDRHMVMDRLHAFLYFLEGLLPRAADKRCAAALCEGIRHTAHYLHEIAPDFARSDVYAQLLRMRIYADGAGVAPLDRAAAGDEAEKLAGFQAAGGDTRTAGGFYFGRKGGALAPFLSPVSTAFAIEALALWDECRGGPAPARPGFPM